METKIGTSFRIRSSFSGGRSLRQANAAKALNSRSVSKHTETGSSANSFYANHRKEFDMFKNGITNGITNSANLKACPRVEPNDYKGRAESAFSFLSDHQKSWNEAFPKRLEKAGIPSDIEFEFDYDINAKKAVITKISDEKYRKDTENVLNKELGLALPFTAYASRIMNGYISSAYYSKVENMLDFRFGQDIKELYIDENGNLCGMNKKMQASLALDKKSSAIHGAEYYSKWHFPSSQPIELIKRLISDKNITPNVSHMGYGKQGIYTNDGDFKFGGKISSDLFSDESAALKGAISLYTNNDFDLWLNNEEMFY